MIADTAPPPPPVPDATRSLPDAAEALRSALDRVRMSQRGYAEVRRRASPAAVTRARTDWGLAVLEWIEASVALAAAEDGRGPGRAAGEGRIRRITVEAGPVRGAIESAWRQYQQVRRTGAADQAAAARAGWRAALVDWFQALAQQRAAEDLQQAQQRRAHEQPAQVQEQEAHGPERPAPGPPEPPDPAHEQDRQAGPAAGPGDGPPAPSRPRRSPPRYQPLSTGWTPAKRVPGS